MSILRRTWPLVALLWATACGDDTGGAGGSGGGTSSASATTSTTGGGEGGAGGTGAGGGPNLDKDPADVTTPDECFYEGEGGANAFYCQSARIDLSTPVESEGFTFRIETSEGDVFDGVVNPDDAGPDPFVTLETEGTTVTALLINLDSPPPHYAPTSLEVEVGYGIDGVATQTYDTLTYACVAQSVDDWCWEAAPLELSIPVE